MMPLKIPSEVHIVVGRFPDRGIPGHPVCEVVMIRNKVLRWEMISCTLQSSSITHRFHAIRVKTLMARYISATSDSSTVPSAMSKLHRSVTNICVPRDMAGEVRYGFKSAVLAAFSQAAEDLVLWNCKRAVHRLTPGMPFENKALCMHSAWKHAEDKCFESLTDSEVVRSLGKSWMRIVMHRWLAHGALKWVTDVYGTWVEAACAFCGNFRADHHSLISVCCGCDRRLYCSRKCQRIDRIAHKSFCDLAVTKCGEQDVDYQVRYVPFRSMTMAVFAMRPFEVGSVIMAGRVRRGLPFAVGICVHEGERYNCYWVRQNKACACLIATAYIDVGSELVCVCKEFV